MSKPKTNKEKFIHALRKAVATYAGLVSMAEMETVFAEAVEDCELAGDFELGPHEGRHAGAPAAQNGKG